MEIAFWICMFIAYLVCGVTIILPAARNRSNTYIVPGYDLFLMYLFWPITLFSIIFVNVFNAMKNYEE